MLEVEGGDPESCLKILRHEVGHAIDNAYQLRRRPTRRRLFGTPATPYPEYYTPKPYSKSFVQHLDHWYAQSHPDEDFAETFAVWLDPQSMWATRYAGLAGAAQARIHGSADARARAQRRPSVTSKRAGRSAAAAAQDARRALPQEARALRPRSSRLLRQRPAEPVLRRARSTRRTRRRRASSGGSARKCAARSPASPTATSTRSISCSRRSSSAAASSTCGSRTPKKSTKIDFMVFLTVQTMNYLHSGRHRVAL